MAEIYKNHLESSKHQLLHYISGFSWEMSILAQHAKLYFEAYILDMVYLESAKMANQYPFKFKVDLSTKNREVSSKEISSYIAETSKCLSSWAQNVGLDFLAYLLHMAHISCQDKSTSFPNPKMRTCYAIT